MKKQHYQQLRYYGANEQGIWIATANDVEFYDFQDLAYFEQSPPRNKQHDIGTIRAFKTIPACNDQEEAVTITAFELTDIPNSYWRFTQLRNWQQQALMNSS